MTEFNAHWRIATKEELDEWRTDVDDEEGTLLIHRTEQRRKAGFRLRPGHDIVNVFGETTKDCVRMAQLMRRDLATSRGETGLKEDDDGAS